MAFRIAEDERKPEQLEPRKNTSTAENSSAGMMRAGSPDRDAERRGAGDARRFLDVRAQVLQRR
jgi:hypothetical protein